MIYFLSANYIEGFTKPFIGKRRLFIDLVSIALVAQDGRKYEAVSREYDYHKARYMQEEAIRSEYRHGVYGDQRNHFFADTFHKHIGKTNRVIASEIYQFICPAGVASLFAGPGSIDEGATGYLSANPPEFWTRTADYTWILFCSLFGLHSSLPKGFPTYCRQLQQELDEKGLDKKWIDTYCPEYGYQHCAAANANWNKELYNQLFGVETGPKPSRIPLPTSVPLSQQFPGRSEWLL